MTERTTLARDSAATDEARRDASPAGDARAVSASYDGSHPTFRLLRAFNWGPMLMNLGWFPFRGPLRILNLAVDLGGTQMALVRKSIRLLDVGAGQSVLDVACGRGKSSYLIGRLHPGTRVVGIDLLPENVHVAGTVFGRTHDLEYQQGDAMNLALDDASFDRVHCLEAAFHFPDRAKFLREAFRVLRPGGRMVLVDFVWRTPLDRELRDDERMRLVRHVWQFDDFHCLDEYEADARAAGFRVAVVRDWSDRVTRPLQTTFDALAWFARRRWGRRLLTLANPLLRDVTAEEWEQIVVAARAHRFSTDHSRYMALVLEKV